MIIRDTITKKILQIASLITLIKIFVNNIKWLLKIFIKSVELSISKRL